MSQDSWDLIVQEFHRLIETSLTERPLQEFFERHPLFLVGFRPRMLRQVVISQLPLGADYRVDFAYFFPITGENILNLIEIESPRLTVFTGKDEFSHSFNHALQQLHDWSYWCTHNREHLRNVFAPFNLRNPLRPIFTLIAGRRGEIESQRRIERYAERKQQLPRNFSYVTYDSIADEIPDGSCERLEQRVKCVCYRSKDFVTKELEQIMKRPK